MDNPITLIGQLIKQVGNLTFSAGMWALFAVSLLTTIPIDIIIFIICLEPSMQDPEGFSFTTKLLLDRLVFDDDKQTSIYFEGFLMLSCSAIFLVLGMGILVALGAGKLPFALAVGHAVCASSVVLGMTISVIGSLIENIGEMLGKAAKAVGVFLELEEEDADENHLHRNHYAQNPGLGQPRGNNQSGHFRNPLAPPARHADAQPSHPYRPSNIP
jgi:hypothetical protein